MTYDLKYETYPDYLLICIKGKWPSRQPQRIINAIKEILADHTKQALLIDIRNMSDAPDTARDYYEAKMFADAGFWKIRRIAVLDGLPRKKANDFFEITAYNRGLRFRFFYAGEKEAINWLKSTLIT